MGHGPIDHLQISRARFAIVALAGAVTVVAGTIGGIIYEQEYGHDEAHFMGALQMLILHTPHYEHKMNIWLEIGRWAGLVTAFSAAAVLVGKRLRREWMRVRASFWSDHVVVCGLGKKGMEVVKCISKAMGVRHIVVIDPAPEPALADACVAAGACLITGDASQAAVLKEARVTKAREVVVITPADEVNVRIAAEVRSACVAANATTRCHVHLSDIYLRDALGTWVEQSGKPGAGRLHFFDVFDSEARRVLQEHPLDGAGITKDSPTSVHVVILGFGRMGRSLTLRAAKMGHFANRKPVRVSAIDRDAATQKDRFLFRHPAMSGGRICDLQFHPMEAESEQTRKLFAQWMAEANTLLHVFVTLDDDARGLELALRLNAIATGKKNVKILVRLRSEHSLAPILDATDGSTDRLFHFGMPEHACSDGAFQTGELDRLATAIHQAHVQRCIATTARRPETDPALRNWDELREDIRESNRQQADHLCIKLRAIGCELVESDASGGLASLSEADVETLSPVEHARWNAERWLAGWQYGTPGDKTLRISPHLARWDELDPSIQEYDRVAIRQIPELVKVTMPTKKIVRRM